MGTSREGSIRAPRLTCHGRNIGPLQMDILSVMGANSIPIESELQWALVPCAFRFWCLSACQCWGTRDAGSPISGTPPRRRPARALCESDLYPGVMWGFWNDLTMAMWGHWWNTIRRQGGAADARAPSRPAC